MDLAEYLIRLVELRRGYVLPEGAKYFTSSPESVCFGAANGIITFHIFFAILFKGRQGPSLLEVLFSHAVYTYTLDAEYTGIEAVYDRPALYVAEFISHRPLGRIEYADKYIRFLSDAKIGQRWMPEVIADEERNVEVIQPKDRHLLSWENIFRSSNTP